MSQNPNAVANQGEFAGHVKPIGNDDSPEEFHATTLPAGSAPASNTLTPNPDLNNQNMYQDAASSTLTGASSADVHTGHGHPGQGQTSNELRHAEKKRGQGLVGVADRLGQGNIKDLKDDPKHAQQRNLDDVPTGQRGNTGGASAQESVPESAETVAADATQQR
ncbi:hypothetical protein ACEQ8H_006007 [Pleosporales sp. CAS-2024a]